MVEESEEGKNEGVREGEFHGVPESGRGVKGAGRLTREQSKIQREVTRGNETHKEQTDDYSNCSCFKSEGISIFFCRFPHNF